MKEYGIANILVMGIVLGIVTGISSFMKIRLGLDGLWPPKLGAGIFILSVSFLTMVSGIALFLKKIKRINQIDYRIATISGFLISSGLYWVLSSIEALANR